MSENEAEVSGKQCAAELTHTHGVSFCALKDGHDGQHAAYCGICLDDGYDDPSDRLHWNEQREDWTGETRRGTVKHLVHWYVPWFGIYYQCACGRFEKRPYQWASCAPSDLTVT